MYWLLAKRSKITTENELLIYKAIIKLVCTYRMKLWGTVCNSNVEILHGQIINDKSWDLAQTTRVD